MVEKKRETFVYEGLGFPVLLVNVPMRKSCGEWVMDINFDQLQRIAMLALVKKNDPLSGREIRSIRHYLSMSTHQFSEELGVTHVAILNWENEERKMNPDSEITLRLYLLDHLNVTDKEFRRTFKNFDRKSIAKRRIENIPLEIDVEKIAC